MVNLPNPFQHIHLLTLYATRGANFWSTRPVTRMDVTLDAYEDISSADAPGCVDQLLAAVPSLVEHRCSLGVRGGFVQRLRRGTYAAHIAEHVAIELQCMMGHEVGFGQTRGTGGVGEYTVVFEHQHADVGMRSAAFALEIVQHAFAGTLTTGATGRHRVPMVTHMIAELRALARERDREPIQRQVLCGVTGGTGRIALIAELGRDDVVDVSPSFLLQAGLPYSSSDVAVILDANITDVPERYRDPERAARLVSILTDAVPEGGPVVCPNDLHYVHDRVRNAGRVVYKFVTHEDVSERVRRAAAVVRSIIPLPSGLSIRSHGAA